MTKLILHVLVPQWKTVQKVFCADTTVHTYLSPCAHAGCCWWVTVLVKPTWSIAQELSTDSLPAQLPQHPFCSLQSWTAINDYQQASRVSDNFCNTHSAACKMSSCISVTENGFCKTHSATSKTGQLLPISNWEEHLAPSETAILQPAKLDTKVLLLIHHKILLIM